MEMLINDYLFSPKASRVFFAAAMTLTGYLIFSRLSRYYFKTLFENSFMKGVMKKHQQKRVSGFNLMIERTAGAVFFIIFLLVVLSELNFNINPIILVGCFGGIPRPNVGSNVISGTNQTSRKLGNMRFNAAKLARHAFLSDHGNFHKTRNFSKNNSYCQC